jgi:hypothetical protein
MLPCLRRLARPLLCDCRGQPSELLMKQLAMIGSTLLVVALSIRWAGVWAVDVWQQHCVTCVSLEQCQQCMVTTLSNAASSCMHSVLCTSSCTSLCATVRPCSRSLPTVLLAECTRRSVSLCTACAAVQVQNGLLLSHLIVTHACRDIRSLRAAASGLLQPDTPRQQRMGVTRSTVVLLGRLPMAALLMFAGYRQVRGATLTEVYCVGAADLQSEHRGNIKDGGTSSNSGCLPAAYSIQLLEKSTRLCRIVDRAWIAWEPTMWQRS